MRPQANPLYLTACEVAAQLRVRPSTVRWLIRTQQLTAQRIAEEFLIDKSDLVAFIDAHTIRGHPEWRRRQLNGVKANGGRDGPLGCQVVDPGGGGGRVWWRGRHHDELGYADSAEGGEVGRGAVGEGHRHG